MALIRYIKLSFYTLSHFLQQQGHNEKRRIRELGRGLFKPVRQRQEQPSQKVSGSWSLQLMLRFRRRIVRQVYFIVVSNAMIEKKGELLHTCSVSSRKS
jgi:hypothetical protein